MWGIVPAAGKGSRIQPLAFSKELLPLHGLSDDNLPRPRAVSDFLMERLVAGGATRICIVISPEKSDIVHYYGSSVHGASICYAIQRTPAGLCDALFQAIPFIAPDEPVLIGLPDTIWFPADGLCHLANDRLSFLLFPVDEPQFFDAVELDSGNRVIRIRVKEQEVPSTNLIWGAFKMPAGIFLELHELWLERGCADEYVGTLVNAWLQRGGEAYGVPAGTSYWDVGTMSGYVEAVTRTAAGGLR